MIVVGLTGGIATGKSTVARLFQECGAAVIDADVLARQAVEPGKPAWRDIVRTFGKGILNSDRTINRRALGAIVFRAPAKLRRLNAIVHPRVARAQARLVREIARKDPDAVIIYDVPLLFEAAAHRRMDRVVVVTADRKTQIARLQQRNHLTRAEALRRIRSQMPLGKKTSRADYVLDGTLPMARLRREVARIFEHLRHSA
ncbi:MAG TPA: dephospho-CoA kinase [Nitrospiraceae bacterium]|jgi:dephospho-CoA kinase|nr:dephospho-CoA kinase [Nitrospiraceae bacterium]